MAEFPRCRRRRHYVDVTKHGGLKVLALALTIVAWFVLAYNPSTVQRTFVVPIAYRNVPAEMHLDPAAPSEARVTLSGSEGNFRFLEPSTLTISIDLGKIRSYGQQTITITEDNIRLPTNLELYRIEPHTIQLDLRKPEPPPNKSES